MNRLSCWLTCALLVSACGARLRDVPSSLDPSNPDGPAAAPPPPVVAANPPAPDESMGNMSGMQHGDETMPGMQHADETMPGMQHGDGGMPGMQHGGEAMPGMQHSDDKSAKPRHENMPGMQHGGDKNTKPQHENMPGMQHGEHEQETGTENKKKVEYTCPMHPQIRSDKPGRCPICGMTLVPAAGGKP